MNDARYQAQMTLTDRQRYVLEMAVNGNLQPADELELKYLNNPAHGIFPHYEDGSDPWPVFTKQAVALYRGWTPDCRTAVNWKIYTPCPACEYGVKSSKDECTQCTGAGSEGSVIFVMTDIDGLILGESDAD